MQALNQMMTDERRLLTGQVQPVKSGFQLTMLNATNCSQAVAFDQHGNEIKKKLPVGAQCFKESSLVSTESMVAGSAIIATFSMAIDFDVWGADLSKVWTRRVVTPLWLSLHSASPRLV